MAGVIGGTSGAGASGGGTGAGGQRHHEVVAEIAAEEVSVHLISKPTVFIIKMGLHKRKLGWTQFHVEVELIAGTWKSKSIGMGR